MTREELRMWAKLYGESEIKHPAAIAVLELFKELDEIDKAIEGLPEHKSEVRECAPGVTETTGSPIFFQGNRLITVPEVIEATKHKMTDIAATDLGREIGLCPPSLPPGTNQ